MDKLRVALATRFPYHETDAYSGLSQVSLRLADALARREDVELRVLSLSPRVARREVRTSGAYPIVFFPKRPSLVYYGTGTLLASWTMRQELRRARPDIVHAQAIAETVIGGLWSGCPLVATLHGLYSSEVARTASARIKWASQIMALAESWYTPRLRQVISCTPYVTRFVRARAPGATLHDISNPLDPAFFDVRLDGPPADPHSVLMVGSISYRKGQDLALAAFARLRARLPTARLTLAGPTADPAYAAQLQTFIKTEGLSDAVRWLGPVSQPQLIAEMQAHRVLCLPSREETLPMSLSQAMVVGNVCVASDAGGIPDMLRHGENGYMFPSGDAEALGRVLEEVLRQPPAASQAMLQSNRAFAERTHHPDAVAAQTVAVYRQVLRKDH